MTIQLPLWAGKMKQILHWDWRLEWATWRNLARSGLPTVTRKKIKFCFHVINTSLTRFVCLRWLDTGLGCFFWKFMDLNSVSVYVHDQFQNGQYPRPYAWPINHNIYYCWWFQGDSLQKQWHSLRTKIKNSFIIQQVNFTSASHITGSSSLRNTRWPALVLEFVSTSRSYNPVDPKK